MTLYTKADTLITQNPIPTELTNLTEEHVGLLHPAGCPGLVAIAKSNPLAEDPKDRWVQRSFRVSELPEIAAGYAGQENIYISMQRFRRFSRRIENLLALSAVYSDVDFYNAPELRDANPDYVLAYVLSVLEEAHLPHPSLIISTGRGLVLVWLHEPVPAAVLPRWNAMQDIIYKALKWVGADAKAKDAARVLRLAGSVHGASGEVVRIIGGDKAVWGFDELANEILPHSREEVAKFRDLRVQKALRRKKSKEKRKDSDKKGNLQGYSRVTLAQARLRDLQALRESRYGAGVPMEDLRDRWLLIATCEIAYLADPAVLKDEVKRLAKDIGYPERTAMSNMSGAIDRAVRAARGEKITYADNKVDPRYRYTNERIIEELAITPQEEKMMETIIGKEEKRRRDVERKRKMRREAGMIDRKATARKNRLETLTRTLRGDSVKQIADALHLSESRIKQIRRDLKQSGELEDQREGGVTSVHAVERTSEFEGGVTPKIEVSLPENSAGGEEKSRTIKTIDVHDSPNNVQEHQEGTAYKATPYTTGHSLHPTPTTETEEHEESANSKPGYIITRDVPRRLEAPPGWKIITFEREPDPNEEPCIHSGLGNVYPGGVGCYICDGSHPLRHAVFVPEEDSEAV